MNELDMLKDIEKRIVHLDKMFKEMIEASNSFILRWNRNGISFVNQHALDFFGYKEEEIIGKDIMILVPGKESTGRDLKSLIYDIIDHPEKHVNSQNENIKKNGERVWVAWTNKGFTGENGMREIVTIGNDVTQLVRHEEDLLRREREFQKTLGNIVEERTQRLMSTEHELEQLRRISALGQLAAVIAHELRNPLSAIQMAAFNISRKTDGKIAGNLETINRKVEESNQIISDVLFYARLKPPSVRPVVISDIIRESLETLLKAGRCEGRVVLEMQPLEGVSIEADPVQLGEVFTNIIDNACDAIKDIKDREGRITIGGRREGGVVRVYVNDNGVGMNQKTLEKLEKPFFTTKSQGTGLGMTVARQIIALHNGRIEIVSEEGKGTSITLILPLKH